MQQPTVYRGRRDQTRLVLACSIPFLMFGATIAWAPTPLALTFTVFQGACGVLVLVVGFAALRTRVVVSPDGISKTPYFAGGFAIAWDAVDVWSVTDLGEERDTFSHRAVFFSVGRRRMEVREAEVFHPGFDRFLQDVRSCVGGREAAPRANGRSV